MNVFRSVGLFPQSKPGIVESKSLRPQAVLKAVAILLFGGAIL